MSSTRAYISLKWILKSTNFWNIIPPSWKLLCASVVLLFCFRISSSQLLKIFIRGKKNIQKLQLERDIKSMHSSLSPELPADVQPSLLHFFVFYYSITKKIKSSTTASHERQEKYTPRGKMQMKDYCFQMHHGKWKPRELPSLRKAVEVSSPKNSTSRSSQIRDLWASWKFSSVWAELHCNVLSVGAIYSNFLWISVSSSQLCSIPLFLCYL